MSEEFKERQEADYAALVEFETTTVAARIREAERFVAEMKRLLDND